MRKTVARQNSPFSRAWQGWAESFLAQCGTQRRMGEICKVDHSYVNLWLAGYVPSRKMLDKMAKSLPAREAKKAYAAAGYLVEGVA